MTRRESVCCCLGLIEFQMITSSTTALLYYFRPGDPPSHHVMKWLIVWINDVLFTLLQLCSQIGRWWTEKNRVGENGDWDTSNGIMISDNRTVFQVTNLQPFTVYSFHVVAVAPSGPSIPSKESYYMVTLREGKISSSSNMREKRVSSWRPQVFPMPRLRSSFVPNISLLNSWRKIPIWGVAFREVSDWRKKILFSSVGFFLLEITFSSLDSGAVDVIDSIKECP